MKDAELARTLLYVADELDGKAYQKTGVIRVAARRLIGLERQRQDGGSPEGGTCEWCGGPILRVNRGRPRRFCRDRCRRAAGGKGGNARVAPEVMT
jgi:hypothetical protein